MYAAVELSEEDFKPPIFSMLVLFIWVGREVECCELVLIKVISKELINESKVGNSHAFLSISSSSWFLNI